MTCPEIVEAIPIGGHRLRLRFSDGVEGEVDVSEVVAFRGVVAALKNPVFFEQVAVDETWGTVTWPGDLDLAPEPLCDRIVQGAAAHQTVR
ncbi:DUF2442 domain-containing protein [Myxococcota bacterium]|nr:DUF2442 domain-containing protein [Myxococcota bacterium]